MEVQVVDQRLDRLSTRATSEVVGIAINEFTPQVFIVDDHARVEVVKSGPRAIEQVDFFGGRLGE